MAQFFEVHPDNPHTRLLKQAVALLERGGIAAVPTDSSYALVCHLDDKAAADSLRRIRGVDDKHHLTLLCRDLSELANYARVDNKQFRLLKAATPGPLHLHPRGQQGSAAPPEPPFAQDHRPARARAQGAAGLLELHGAPLLATTLIPRGGTEPLNDAQEIRELMEHELAAVIDAGACHQEPPR
jgi:tRNA threonylcarbamoyl adenosine modification protein (Sua5/YciO/YrdC/YwlC family)